MSFILARPPSPPPREEDTLAAALHAALQSFGAGPSHQPSQHTPHTPAHTAQEYDMLREKGEKFAPSLEINVNSDTLYLRGTGVDVDPALLSGNVILQLSEPIAIKEIRLQFRGKARVPTSANESISLNSASSVTYIMCNHEWSFLEGTRSHSHTLKAGRHLFPFQLHLGGSLPSSISTSALGGACIYYKLRATVVRPGFSLTHRDLHVEHPIYILRNFSTEALEYQQTLEIENTWPDKLMYSIVLPHKAWAAGDRVTAIVKFSPIAKGAKVLNVTTTVNETVRIIGRMGTQENTRAVGTTRHDIVDGKAVCTDEQQPRYRIPLLHHTPQRTASRSATSPTTPNFAEQSDVHTSNNGGYFPHMSAAAALSPSPVETLSPTGPTFSTSSSSNPPPAASTSESASSRLPSHDGPSTGFEVPAELELEPTSDVVTTLNISLPEHATPTHSLDPIHVSHRIRWSIFIGNLDGHTSELRCSLPLHVLDNRLLDEARSATLATRRLLLGANDVDGGSAVGMNGESSDNEADMELPSYPAHVRDRVANAFLPETGVMRVTNPWIANGVSPTFPLSTSEAPSGMHSPVPLEARRVSSSSLPPPNLHPRNHLPHVPPPGAQPLDWVNSELLLSLSNGSVEAPAPAHPARPAFPIRTPPSRTPPDGGSRPGSRFGSRRGSRANSRAGSPDRSASPGAAGETYVHHSSSASRNLHGLFQASMKPFTSLTSSFSLGSRSSSHSNLQGHAHSHGHGHGGQQQQQQQQSHSQSISSLHDLRRHRSSSSQGSHPGSGAMTPASPPPHAPPPGVTSHLHVSSRDPSTSQRLLHRAFTETPDYEMATRGFLGGGVPPLSSLRGLPSYEEAERQCGGGAGVPGACLGGRSLSGTDLAGQMEGAIRERTERSARRAGGTYTAPPTPPPPPTS